MLSLAYGADQSDKYQVHRPEICYPAQGYQIYGLKKQRLVSAYGEIAAQKLFARRNNGVIEEIDYWVMVGDVLVFSGFDRKLAQLKYGFGGKIPDGMLIRISSLSEDGNSSRQNKKFIDDLLQALNANDRARIIGY
jgi:EpsI family protein